MEDLLLKALLAQANALHATVRGKIVEEFDPDKNPVKLTDADRKMLAECGIAEGSDE